MKVSPSKFEVLVHIELQRRGLAKYLKHKDSVIILDAEPVTLPPEKVTKDMLNYKFFRCQFTKPDFIFDRALIPGFKPKDGVRSDLLVYLDGPPHRKRGVKNRDDRIHAKLVELRYEPLRIDYTRPTKRAVKQAVDSIEENLK